MGNANIINTLEETYEFYNRMPITFNYLFSQYLLLRKFEQNISLIL